MRRLEVSRWDSRVRGAPRQTALAMNSWVVRALSLALVRIRGHREQMKVLNLPCVCMTVTAALVGCAVPVAGSEEADAARTHGAQEDVPSSADRGRAEASETVTADCPDLTPDQISCGQIGISLKGLGSSCQLVPTANDLTRPPRSVRFDCGELQLGPNGYDYDALGHLTLTGNTCDALQKGGAHRVTLILACPPA